MCGQELPLQWLAYDGPRPTLNLTLTLTSDPAPNPDAYPTSVVSSRSSRLAARDGGRRKALRRPYRSPPVSETSAPSAVLVAASSGPLCVRSSAVTVSNGAGGESPSTSDPAATQQEEVWNNRINNQRASEPNIIIACLPRRHNESKL